MILFLKLSKRLISRKKPLMITLKTTVPGNTSVFEKIMGRIKGPFYKNVNGLTNGFENLDKRCLLNLKTTPLYRKSNQHANMWETRQIIYTLNSLGYLVDIVSPEVDNFHPKDEYDLFLGYGSGNSGRHFYKYSKLLKRAKSIIYASGPEPSLSNTLVRERYDKFNERTGLKAPYMRINNINFNQFVSVADAIFCIGEPQGFSIQSYEKHCLPTYPIIPSSNYINSYKLSGSAKSRKHFLCFAGSGLICKGVDILVEAFSQLPDCHLHICGPMEKALFAAYGDLIDASLNITFHGFIDVNGKDYQKIIKECSFTLLHSAAEGCCGSIINNMASGLVPIVNYETGIDVEGFGFFIPKHVDRIKAVKEMVLRCSEISNEDYRGMVSKTLNASKCYSKTSFSNSFRSALEDFIV